MVEVLHLEIMSLSDLIVAFIPHPLNYKERNKGLELAEPIVVGSNTWFGGHVSVMPGVTGDGSVIGAGVKIYLLIV